MEYNLAGIRSQVVNDKLDDDTFDPTVVNNFINATQRSIFNTYELPYMEKVFSGTLPDGKRIFTFPKDLQVIQSVVVTDPEGNQRDITDKRLNFKDFNKIYPTPGNNEPAQLNHWMSYAGQMYTSAPLDVGYQMDTYYIKKPDTLTADTDVPELPEEFQELLVLGAFYRVLQRNEDYDLAAVVKNEYNDLLDLLVSRYGFRVTSGPIQMRQPRNTTSRRRR